jgi:hypothetical protein
MSDIPVRVCGDHWINPQEITELLTQHNPQQCLTLDMGTEGACINTLGIQSVLLEYCSIHGHDPQKVIVKNWPNSVAEIPFQRAYQPRVSHFFWMCKKYWTDPLKYNNNKRFAFFIGRKTFARASMMYELYKTAQHQWLFSVMDTHNLAPWQTEELGVNQEKIEQWVSDIDSFKAWWDNCPVTSIDNRDINDQYKEQYNTNLDLLKFYSEFGIELVAETYTLGNTFFPTEKTVRPIVAQRAWLIYGPQNFIANMKRLGFQSYNKFWDEGYDQLEGPKRWAAIKKILRDLSMLTTSEWEKLMHEIDSISFYNRRHLQQLINQYSPNDNKNI